MVAPAQPAPVESPSVPAKEEVAPPAPAPTAEVVAPATEAPAPAPATPAPATVAPTTEVAAPVPTPIATAQPEVAAPAPVTPAPTAEVAPAPTTEAPVTPAPAPEVVASAPVGDAGVVIDHFEFRYGLAHPALPPLEQLNGMTIQATRDGNVFRAPSTKGAENLTLSGIPEGSRFDSGALLGIAQDVVRWYNARGLYGVWVAFSDLESSPTGLVDNRPADNHTAHLVIWASQVAEVRTLARGKRFKPQFSVNNPKHRRLIAHSPLHPGATPDQPGSLFRQDVLNDYLHGLSQHPGRLVEASIASAGEPGKLVLDYLVNESKPWQIFSQVNNFGTAATGQWRVRLGYQNNQLTNHDDILNVNVISTPNFKTYGSFLSYRIPVFRPAKLLARVYGSYGDFLAIDAPLQNLPFAGNNLLIRTQVPKRLSLPNN